MFKLEDNVVKSIKSCSTSYEVLELSKSDVFIMSYTLFKENKKESEEVMKQLKLVVADSTKISTTKAYFTRIFTLSKQYVELDVFIKFDILHYETLAKVVKILKYIHTSKEYDNATFKSVKDRLSKVYMTSLGEYSYNNLMDNMVSKLKEEYKVTEVEGEYKSLDFNTMLHTVNKSINTYSQEQLIKLAKLIENKIEVAA